MFYKKCICCSSQFIPPTWDYVLASCSYVSVTRYQTCYRSRLNCHRRCCSGFQSSGGNCLRKSPWYSDALHSSVATYICTYCIPLYMHVLLLLHTQTNTSSGLLPHKERVGQDPGYALRPQPKCFETTPHILRCNNMFKCLLSLLQWWLSQWWSMRWSRSLRMPKQLARTVLQCRWVSFA